jgi:hypothetical protein
MNIKATESKSEEIKHEEVKLKDKTDNSLSKFSHIRSSNIITTNNAPSVDSIYPITNNKEFKEESLKKVAIMFDIK